MHTKAEVVSARSVAFVFGTRGTQMLAIVGSVNKRLVKHLPSARLHGMWCLNVLGREVWDRVKT